MAKLKAELSGLEQGDSPCINTPRKRTAKPIPRVNGPIATLKRAPDYEISGIDVDAFGNCSSRFM
jgi:hypothetical protein